MFATPKNTRAIHQFILAVALENHAVFKGGFHLVINPLHRRFIDQSTFRFGINHTTFGVGSICCHNDCKKESCEKKPHINSIAISNRHPSPPEYPAAT